MVNLAARFQGESRGGDIVLSTEMIESAGPNDQIEGAEEFELVQDSGHLSGFDNPITYWRMMERSGIP
jgi:class 3 adenylate cyclase